jgi:hypothetical protein
MPILIAHDLCGLESGNRLSAKADRPTAPKRRTPNAKHRTAECAKGPRLKCGVEHVTFGCFEPIEDDPVCLHREYLSQSDGRRLVPADGEGSPGC